MGKYLHATIILLLLVMLLAFFPVFSSSKSGHLTLLTVSTTGNASYGGIADLYLDIKPV